MVTKTLYAKVMVFVLALLTLSVGACTNATTGQWVNCTIPTNSTSPISAVFCTPYVNGGSWVYDFLFMVLYVGIMVLMYAQDMRFVKYVYGSFFGMILSFAFAGFTVVCGGIDYAIIAGGTVSITIAIFAVTLIAEWFLD